MEKLRKLNTLRNYCTILKENPRVSDSFIHRKISPYNSLNSTIKLLREAHEKKVIIGPFLFCNSGFSFEIRDDIKNPLKALKQFEMSPSNVSHAIALSGRHSLLVFRRGGSDLRFADAIIPLFPAKDSIDHLEIKEVKGKLKEDKYPKNWNETDWNVYKEMRNPSVSFGKIGGRLGVKWITVKRHYLKILKDCKVLTAFFPKGYSGYSRMLAIFKTKFEISLLESLKKFDRSSYVWKCNNSIILILFVDNFNLASERMEELNEIGMIRDLCISIPSRYFEPNITIG